MGEVMTKGGIMTQVGVTGNPDNREQTRARTRRRIVTTILQLWLIAVLVFFLWEAMTYRGFYAALSEWQFDTLGNAMPILTYVALTLVFALPCIWLLKSNGDGEGVSAKQDRADALSAAVRFRKLLSLLAAGLAIVSVGTAIYALAIPGRTDKPIPVAVDAARASPPESGATALTGVVMTNRIAKFHHNLLFVRRDILFAPVVASSGATGPLTYFAELPGGTASTTAGRTVTMTGILRRDGLPGPIERLYRYAGYQVGKPHFVLFASLATIRLTYFVAAAQLGIFALIALASALFQQRHVRNLTRASMPPSEGETVQDDVVSI